MKKISIILAALGLFISTATMAIPEERVAHSVKDAFYSNFSKATKVRWDKIEEFYFATFTLDKKEVNVAYNEAGELVGSSELISISVLPLLAQIALREQYGQYQHSQQAYRITCNGETFYYVTAVNERRLLKLKCTDDGNITVVEKTKITRQ